jgi:hypothetical protein
MFRVYCVPFTSNMRFSSEVKKWRFVEFGYCGAHKTGSVVTIRKFDHGFPLVFNAHFLYNMRRFKVILVF